MIRIKPEKPQDRPQEKRDKLPYGAGGKRKLASAITLNLTEAGEPLRAEVRMTQALAARLEVERAKRGLRSRQEVIVAILVEAVQ